MEVVMKKTPFFSVVVPIYNKRLYINRSISSILKQSFTDFELIIINDNSTDGSMEEVNKFYDNRINIYHRKKPGPGGYAARNLAINLSTGEWIAFLDADDEWFPNHLEKMSELVLKYPDIGFLSCGWIEMYSNKKIKDKYYTHKEKYGKHIITLSQYLKYNLSTKKNPVCTDVACVKSNIAKNLIPFPENKAQKGGDRYAWLLILSKTNMAWSPHIGAIYWRNTANRVTNNALINDILPREIVLYLKKKISTDNLDLLKKHSNR